MLLCAFLFFSFFSSFSHHLFFPPFFPFPSQLQQWYNNERECCLFDPKTEQREKYLSEKEDLKKILHILKYDWRPPGKSGKEQLLNGTDDPIAQATIMGNEYDL